MAERNEKVAQMIKQMTASFIERENNRTSLITVTSCTVSHDLKKALIGISVLPESKERGALGFLKRKRGEIRAFIKKNLKIKNIPNIEIEIDKGEKNRQKIDTLLRE